jgi:mannosyl-3-phosphoglycerate phosphatase
MGENQQKLVVFSDLDGTLLDRVTYSYDKALPTIEYLREKEIPIVFCSAKTRMEQEVYRHKLKVFHPFVVENGGAIFIPTDYFPFSFDFRKTIKGFLVIEFGTPYEKIRESLDKIRQENKLNFRGYGDMSIKEIAGLTGLDEESAELASKREYTETIIFDATDKEVEMALQKIKQGGLDYAEGGRFYEVMVGNDKGKATAVLIGLYRRLWGKVTTIGIGDSLNDLPMLSTVDSPVLVQKPEGVWEQISLPQLYKIEGIGPEGWIRAIRELVINGRD